MSDPDEIAGLQERRRIVRQSMRNVENQIAFRGGIGSASLEQLNQLEDLQKELDRIDRALERASLDTSSGVDRLPVVEERPASSQIGEDRRETPMLVEGRREVPALKLEPPIEAAENAPTNATVPDLPATAAVTTASPLTTNAQATAEPKLLHRFTKTSKAKVAGIFTGVAIIAAGIIAAGLGALGVYPEFRWLLIIGGLLGLLFGVSWIIDELRTRDLEMRLYEDRLEMHERGELTAVRWKDVTAVTKLIETKSKDGSTYVSFDGYLLAYRRGQSLRVPSTLTELEAFERLLLPRVRDYVYVRMLDQYRERDLITCGPLILNRAGIQIAQRLIAWKRVQRIVVQEPSMMLVFQDNPNVQKLAELAALPNYFVLDDLRRYFSTLGATNP